MKLKLNYLMQVHANDDYEWFTYLFDNGFIEPITIYKNSLYK